MKRSKVGLAPRVVTTTGVLGCGSKTDDPVGEGGVLFPVRTANDLDELIAHGNANSKDDRQLGALSLVLEDALLDASTMAKMVKIDETEGLRVANAIIVQKEGYGKVGSNNTGPSPESASSWNPGGDGLSSLTIPFSVTMVQNVQEGSTLWDKATENEKRVFGAFAWQHGARFQFYLGKSSVTSQQCLELKMCDPLGGLSVWGTIVGANSNSSNTTAGPGVDLGREQVLVTTGMDSSAFFHDLALGRESAASGLAVLLLAVQALGKVSAEQLAELPRQIGFAAFQGEAWARIGSRRFLRDISSGNECERFEPEYNNQSCAEPAVYSLAWTNLSTASISHVLALDQLANTLEDAFYLHYTAGEPGDAFAASFADAQQARQASDKVNLLNSSAPASQGLPPSPLDTFVEEASWNGAGLVLTGYDDSYQPGLFSIQA